MDWSETLDGFHLNDQLPFNQKVDPETIGKSDTVKLYRQDFLSLNGEPYPRKLRRKDGFVNGFEKTWSEVAVQPEPAIDRDACELLNIPQTLRAFLRFFVPSCDKFLSSATLLSGRASVISHEGTKDKEGTKAFRLEAACAIRPKWL